VEVIYPKVTFLITTLWKRRHRKDQVTNTNEKKTHQRNQGMTQRKGRNFR
jgi:hypothetical protein